MKSILVLVFACMLIIYSCTTPYIIINQEQLMDCPSQILNTGVNVRIRNISKITFGTVALHITGKNVTFAGLKRGMVTCYKNVPSIWTNNSIDILLSKQPGYVKTLMITSVDHVGEQLVKHGTVTIDVNITKPNYSSAITHLNIDSK